MRRGSTSSQPRSPLVSAIGVLVANSKVDRLTGRGDALEVTLHLVVTAILSGKSSEGVVVVMAARRRSPRSNAS